jgi:hypothetical protein
VIAALRRRHRAMTTALVITLPILYGVIILQREPPTLSRPVPAADTVPRRPAGPVWTLLESPRLTGQLLTAPGEDAPSALRVTPDGDPAIPDLLAYWDAVTPADSVLPAESILLGALRGSRQQILALPAPARGRAGRVILYSMGWRRVVGSAPLEPAP